MPKRVACVRDHGKYIAVFRLFARHGKSPARARVVLLGVWNLWKGSEVPEQYASGSTKIALAEGAAVYTSDGARWGTVDAVGARYFSVVRGLLGHETYHLPLTLVARADRDRVDLAVSAKETGRYAGDRPPADEPIYGESEPIPDTERAASGIPVDRRATFGLGG
jgi:hypothetical protein